MLEGEEFPCELVREQHFLGLGVPAKQSSSGPGGREWEGRERERERERDTQRERESRMGWGRLGEQGQCWECTRSRVLAPNVRKNAAHKENS
jgi:hypothetical protein